MSFNPGLNFGDEISNEEIMDIFKCSNQGGMRPSKKTNSLVLISKRIGSIYNDRRVGNEVLYTGMGLTGDQKIKYQNKSLYYSNENDITVHFFEVNDTKIYTYMGRAKLAGKPFQEEQEDNEKNIRKVWIFPIKLIDYQLETNLTEKEFKRKQEKQEEQAKKLKKGDLEKKAQQSDGQVKLKKVLSNVYERNPYVAGLAKINANGTCQLCGEEAPFKNRYGDPYLEVHHIDWLSKGGKDIIENVTALCPNCHKKMHILNLKKDKVILKNKFY